MTKTKIILLIASIFMISDMAFSQCCRKTDSTNISYFISVGMPEKDLINLINREDSLNNIILKPDTLSTYQVYKIKRTKDHFVIHAKRKIDDKLYYYRIKSNKVKGKHTGIRIRKGKSYQFDLRADYCRNCRVHFVPGIGLGATMYGLSDFDIVYYMDENVNRYIYNEALHLKGLFLKN